MVGNWPVASYCFALCWCNPAPQALPLAFSPGVGLLVLSASQTNDKDNLWLVDSDLFPFQSALIESHVSGLYLYILLRGECCLH